MLNRDYRLQNNSPCIDKGLNLITGSDFQKNNIPQNGRVDIGAFEFVIESPMVLINTKVFLEGPYSNGKMSTLLEDQNLLPKTDPYLGIVTLNKIPANIVDWVLIELRTGTSKNTMLFSKPAFIRSDGKIVDEDGISNVAIDGLKEGDYYLIIKHRNHLKIMSSKPIHLSQNSELYDFSSNINSAFGKDALVKLGNNNYGMYSGDGDANGMINIVDYKSVGNYIFQFGYMIGDLDMNSIIDIRDFEKSSKNLFKCSQVPN